MRVRLGYLSAGVSLIVIAALVLLFTPVGTRPLGGLFAIGDVASVDFSKLALTDKPNQYLVCPPGLCAANPQAESPLFDIPVEQLRARWRDVVAAQPRIALLAEDQDGRQFDYVQRSARFRFPDIITVRFISLSPSQSTLAIYSRAIYGTSDFGVNHKRIDAWLKSLRERR